MSKLLSPILKACCSAALVVALLPAGAIPAHASVGNTFTTSVGLVDGTLVETGTQLTFKVLSEPEGNDVGTVQVGTGSGLSIDSSYAGAVTVPEQVRSDEATYTVVSTAPYSFNAAALTSVSLPKTLTRIGRYSFNNCLGLQSVDIPQDAQLKYIEAYSFQVPSCAGCLQQIRFPASLASVGDFAFYGQAALTSLSFDGSAMERLGQFAFSQCTGLVSAEVPELTSNTSAIGIRAFKGCSSLETVVFKGNVASQPEDVVGTRYFEGCTSLKTVVYCGKKCIPTTGRYGGGSGSIAESFIDSDPTLYYTVSYYASEDEAVANVNQLGYVRVRSDVALSQIVSGIEETAGAGEQVYEGAVASLPAGFDAWAYEGSPDITSAIPDSLYAFPVHSADLANANVLLERETYDFTGSAVMPKPEVRDASGRLLAEGTDYELSYERLAEDGTWAEAADTTAEGSMRVVVSGQPGSAYSGSICVEYAISRAAEGSSFVADGVTYGIVAAASDQAEGTVSVGDGTNHAVADDASGELVIPASVRPDGSAVSYSVVSVADYAFGGSDYSEACAELSRVVLPEGIEQIGIKAFAYCEGLESMAIPASVESIGAYAFAGCIGLEDIEFAGDSVDFLGTHCFAQCASLESLTLPNVARMRDHAFANCVRLNRIDFTGSIPADEETTFAGCTRLSRVVFHGPRCDAAFSSDVTFYFVVTFEDSAGSVIATVPVKEGTEFEKIKNVTSASAALGGELPAVPEPYAFWQFDAAGSSLDSVCTAVPAGTAGQDDVPDEPEAPAANKYVNGSTWTAGKKTSRAVYRIISASAKKVAYVKAKSTSKAKAVVPQTVKIAGKTYKITAVGKKAFASSKVKTVKVGSRKVTTFVKAFKGSKVSKVAIPKAKKRAYKKLLTKAKCGKKVKVTTF